MSDEHKDPSVKYSGPGHEVDSPPTKELFNIVWGFGGLTLLSIVTCAQLFYQQERDISEERAKESSYQLVAYRKEMTERANGSGSLEFKDATGNTIRQKFRPIEAARQDVLKNPDLLRAAKAPVGWVHPDDIAAGGQGGAAPADQAVGAPAVPNPVGTTPEPAVGAPAGGVIHPLGEPAVLPPGTGPVDPTSAEPIRPTPVEPPPPTPSIPAANPEPVKAPPVEPAPKPATPKPAEAQPTPVNPEPAK